MIPPKEGTVPTGILLMLAAMAVVPIMDGFAKELSSRFSVWQIVWGRFFFHLILLLPVVLMRYGGSALLPRHPVMQVVRGGLLLVATILFFAAISIMPIADTLAIYFISPLLVTAMSPFILGEEVGFKRYTAVIVGFIGVLIIIRPGFMDIHIGVVLSLVGGVVYSLYAVTTRKLAGSAPPLVTLTFTAILGAIVMSLIVPFQWISPTATDWALMAGMGLCAACGHYLLIKAFDYAEASVLAPFSYSEIIMATVVGYVGFGDFPDTWTWTGIGVIIMSGIYVSMRERENKVIEPVIIFQAEEAFPEEEENNVNR